MKCFRRKFSFSLLFCLILNANLYGNLQSKKLRVAIEGSYPPFSEVTPTGELKGFEVDLAKAFCKEMAVTCELVQQDWDGLIPGLMIGKFDLVVASMTVTEERKQKVDFSRSYYRVPARFVGKKNSGIEIKAEVLKDKVIGVQRGTIHDQYVTTKFKSQVKRYDNAEKAFLDLSNGRIDLFFGDIIPINQAFLSGSRKDHFEFIGPEFVDSKWFGDGIGAAVKKGNKELVDVVNKAIMATRKNGVYQSIQKKYFDFDVFGKE